MKEDIKKNAMVSIRVYPEDVHENPNHTKSKACSQFSSSGGTTRLLRKSVDARTSWENHRTFRHILLKHGGHKPPSLGGGGGFSRECRVVQVVLEGEVKDPRPISSPLRKMPMGDRGTNRTTSRGKRVLANLQGSGRKHGRRTGLWGWSCASPMPPRPPPFRDLTTSRRTFLLLLLNLPRGGSGTHSLVVFFVFFFYFVTTVPLPLLRCLTLLVLEVDEGYTLSSKLHPYICFIRLFVCMYVYPLRMPIQTSIFFLVQ
uniref:Uncharacterized protein n=1 Tax=Physcomitrium patens TaxID=3218 RepID=A0A2K1K403_PHYPA|nr:hypothetical protein PHYPA_012990 [Physcomitrium patens]